MNTQEIINMTLEAFNEGYKQGQAEALAQDEKFCDGNCVWTDHHPNCKLTKPIQDAIDFLDGSYEAHKIRKALQEALAFQHYKEVSISISEDYKFEWKEPAQEPVINTLFCAVRILSYLGYSQSESIEPSADKRRDAIAGIIANFLTSPPARKWQGLSDDEIDELVVDTNADIYGCSIVEFVSAIEAKLKEKNS